MHVHLQLDIQTDCHCLQQSRLAAARRERYPCNHCSLCTQSKKKPDLVNPAHNVFEYTKEAQQKVLNVLLLLLASLTEALLATGVRVRATLGGNGWSPGRKRGAGDEGGWVSYCESSNKAMRLLPVTGFNIRARILPESPLWHLKNVRHDLKGYSAAQRR